MDNLIYLDAAFISAKFEEITGKSGDAQFSKAEGGKVDVGFAFAKAGVHTQETITFKKSSNAMLRELLPKLRQDYPTIDLSIFKNYSGTQLAWVEGVMSLQAWTDPAKPEDRYDYYGLVVANRKLALISEPAYFTSGFAQVINASSALIGYVGIPVQALVRVLWHVESTGEYVSAPLVLLESRHSQTS